MRKVEMGTNEYTEVIAVDKEEFNANHEYKIVHRISNESKPTVDELERILNNRSILDHDILPDGQVLISYAKVNFQKGPIKENGVNGVHNEDLIAIVLDRLQSFQDSPYSCRENALAITKLEEALMWLRKRTDDRKKRGVEGTSTV